VTVGAAYQPTPTIIVTVRGDRAAALPALHAAAGTDQITYYRPAERQADGTQVAVMHVLRGTTPTTIIVNVTNLAADFARLAISEHRAMQRMS
jgi:hypothetical protein